MFDALLLATAGKSMKIYFFLPVFARTSLRCFIDPHSCQGSGVMPPLPLPYDLAFI